MNGDEPRRIVAEAPGQRSRGERGAESDGDEAEQAGRDGGERKSKEP